VRRATTRWIVRAATNCVSHCSVRGADWWGIVPRRVSGRSGRSTRGFAASSQSGGESAQEMRRSECQNMGHKQFYKIVYLQHYHMSHMHPIMYSYMCILTVGSSSGWRPVNRERRYKQSHATTSVPKLNRVSGGKFQGEYAIGTN
jgi:hypothetical protein